MYDVIIVGAGPAGLSAGLILGRCRRRILVVDSGHPRNAASRGLHGYLTRDGIRPTRLRALGVAELRRYPSVQLRKDIVVCVGRRPNFFRVITSSGLRASSRMLLLATGRFDAVPDKPGFKKFYGRGVYHCPYCDGWENRDQPLVVYGNDGDAAGLALDLLTWTHHITLCTDGHSKLSREDIASLAAARIRTVTRLVSGFSRGTAGRTGILRFADHTSIPCGAVFFSSNCEQKSSLPDSLGCTFDETGGVKCDGHAATNVPGLFVAGNVRGGLHLAITAAAEGAEAAVAINNALNEVRRVARG